MRPAASHESVTVESALRTVLDLRGPDLIAQPALLRAFLDRRCPDAEHDVACVLAGVDAKVPQRLRRAENDDELRVIARTLEKKLRDRHAMNRYAAAWTISTWAAALGITLPATTTRS